ncbi:PP2C family protein-serine/threonine phosphatase [Microbacterium timonense]|uniref:PP2C family protein-serine/threonine phosphatase n=1 Tax=Microbacterium timonense TaxID=2086576 RepID=UPI000D0F80E1|nr:protein phosphatase 2C domain-containing protein [Microbacterium timonense]
MTEPRVRVRAAAFSESGPHRSVNQDSAFTSPWGAAVADGVGGGPAGDLASAAFLHRLVAGRPAGLDAEELATRIRGANWDLRAHVDRDPALRGMSTTFTGVFASRRGGMLLAHTGDSRAYLVRSGHMWQLSRDDSFVQALVDQGLVTPEDAVHHPRRNVITASLSGDERDAAVIAEYEAAAGDRWLLCSDGLTDYVADADILAVLADPTDAETAARRCVELALEADSHDNVTVVVCDVAEGGFSAGEVQAEASFYGAAAGRFTEEFDPS